MKSKEKIDVSAIPMVNDLKNAIEEICDDNEHKDDADSPQDLLEEMLKLY